MPRMALAAAAAAALLALAAPALAHDDPAPQPTTTVAALPDTPPAGDFTFADDPLTGVPVAFTATGVDSAVGESWDLDGDGDFETSGDTARTTFASPGAHTVALRLADARGQSTVVRHVVNVVDRAPVADFSFTGGPDVTFTSRASDPDGGTMQLREDWDLDGDGRFGDASGPVVHHVFGLGTSVVRLRVTDGDGAVDIAEQELTFAPVAAPVAPIRFTAPSAVIVRAISPFPVVRMRGRLTRRGVRVELLKVTAPRGALTAISCRGHGCARSVVGRELRGGAVVVVRVTAPGAIGKWVRFTIRRGKPWLRRDGCLSASGATTRCR